MALTWRQLAYKSQTSLILVTMLCQLCMYTCAGTKNNTLIQDFFLMCRQVA